jgi:hypothetical protein
MIRSQENQEQVPVTLPSGETFDLNSDDLADIESFGTNLIGPMDE